MMFRPWIKKYYSNKSRQRRAAAAAAGGAVMVVLAITTTLALHVRQRERKRRIQTLPLAKDHLKRDLSELLDHIVRTGLMGTSLPGSKSVKEELHVIRQWHQTHEYKGGIVLRELTKPLFRFYEIQKEDEEAEQDATSPPIFDFTDPMRLARRECYYLYYELLDNGRLRQQIFCRGTTLSVDVLTCLQTWWVYDEVLQCRVHCGFNNHANRMLEDILPLLAPPSADRATIEITGHSLGGAVAMLLAIKLRKLGYKVASVTAIASPRFCGAEAAACLQALLPKDTLRVEDDRDIVPLLPPFGAHVGHKLWLVKDNEPRWVSAEQSLVVGGDASWVDSIVWNLRFWNPGMGRCHRIRNHTAQIKAMMP
jgi:pimeloyl-ACP methyl ester carboxylesterase